MMQIEGHFNAAIPYHVLVVDIETWQYQSYHYHFSDAVRYTSGYLLKEELKQFMTEWNSHRIRPSKMAETPAGIPNVLFQFPELQG